ncbi:MAG TPA: hypothetical protein VHF22_08660 [Planctomycetota bacterium]|nr:hypothetical protein [Planctomycetota bacterium]
MTLLEKLKSLFNRDEIPDETKQIFDSAKTPADLLRGLDNLLTRNEVEAKDLNDEITRVEETAVAEEERVRSGSLPERQKRNALLTIKRLRKTMDNYEGRLRIYERNMNLHLNLIGKIQQMEAMKLGGVDEQQIDRIVMEFEEKLERYGDIMNAAEVHDGKATSYSAKEDRELKALESEILGKRPDAAEQAERELKQREDEGSTRTRSGAPLPDADRPRRRPIEDVIDEAFKEELAEPAPAPAEKKKVELE